MTIRLADLAGCFEGVIPSIVATVAADGTPNISYLSQVVAIDDDHVGLSNQFFSKTVANVRENPHAALVLVDARNGAQFRVDVAYVESSASGPVFDRVKEQIDAASAQVGMAGIFRLRGIDVYRVTSIATVPTPAETASAGVEPKPARLLHAAFVVEMVAAQSDAEGVVEAVLDGVAGRFGYDSTLLLLHDAARGVLTTIASRGYDRSGVGSEVPLGEGLIGSAALAAKPMRVNDITRVQRFVAAVRDSSDDENRTRAIALPGIANARSQIAVPLIAQNAVRGVLFAESRMPLAFGRDDEAALSIVARQTAASLLLAEAASEEPQPASAAVPRRAPAGRPFKVTHHAYDDSVFIDDQYVIKGVAARLLMFMLETHARDGRCDFTNRELRLAPAIRLPEIKDNLETRLVLLRRRLDEKASPVRLARPGRGRIALELTGAPVLEEAGS